MLNINNFSLIVSISKGKCKYFKIIYKIVKCNREHKTITHDRYFNFLLKIIIGVNFSHVNYISLQL